MIDRKYILLHRGGCFSFYNKEPTPGCQNFEMWKPPYKIKIISSKPTEKQIETGKERLNLLFSELEWYFIPTKDTNNSQIITI